MNNISFYDNNNNPLDGFYQWDINRELVVKGASVSPLPVFNFSNSSCGVALVVTPELSGNDLIAPVPNILLQEAKPITLYICYDDSDSFKTSDSVSFTVLPRAKPDDYEYEDNIGDAHYAPIRTATATVLGGVKIGSGLSVTSDGTVSVTGEGGASLPVYILNWYSPPTDAQKAHNAEVLADIKTHQVGEYVAYIKVNNKYISVTGAKVTAISISVSATDFDGDSKNTYVMSVTSGAYAQEMKYFPEPDFDPDSDLAGSMYATAEYIDGLLVDKQDKLTPGAGINITGGVISVSFANGDEVEYGTSNSN